MVGTTEDQGCEWRANVAMAVVVPWQKGRGTLCMGQHLTLLQQTHPTTRRALFACAAVRNIQVQVWLLSCPGMILAFPRLGLHLKIYKGGVCLWQTRTVTTRTLLASCHYAVGFTPVQLPGARPIPSFVVSGLTEDNRAWLPCIKEGVWPTDCGLHHCSRFAAGRTEAQRGKTCL